MLQSFAQLRDSCKVPKTYFFHDLQSEETDYLFTFWKPRYSVRVVYPNVDCVESPKSLVSSPLVWVRDIRKMVFNFWRDVCCTYPVGCDHWNAPLGHYEK